MDDTYYNPRRGYSNKPLEFFYKKGGIYPDLICVLGKLLADHESLPTLETMMTMAYHWASLPGSSNHGFPSRCLRKIYEPYVRYSVAAILFQKMEIRYDVQVALSELDKRDEFYPAFKHFFSIPNPARDRKRRKLDDKDRQIEDLKRQIAERDVLINDMYERETFLESQLENKPQSFSFDRILQYAEEKQFYTKCNQILSMLKHFCTQDGASVQLSQVKDTIRKMPKNKAAKPLTIINNHISNSNAFLGNVSNPTFSKPQRAEDEQFLYQNNSNPRK